MSTKLTPNTVDRVTTLRKTTEGWETSTKILASAEKMEMRSSPSRRQRCRRRRRLPFPMPNCLSLRAAVALPPPLAGCLNLPPTRAQKSYRDIETFYWPIHSTNHKTEYGRCFAEVVLAALARETGCKVCSLVRKRAFYLPCTY